jgi:hypothetical protein
MGFNYLDIKAAIVAKLQPLVTAGTIKVLYGKEEKQLAQFPAVCVSNKGHTAELHDTVSNRKHYQHYVRVYFRTDEDNDADYEDVLSEVADAVIYELEHDLTLGGVADWSLPTSGEWKFVEKETPLRCLELVVQSEARVIR